MATSEMTAQQLEAMAQALQNPMLLHLIFEQLTFPELTTNRLVSQAWKIISTKIIRKRDCCRVSFIYNESANIFRANYWQSHFTDDGESCPDLHQLNNLLKKSTNFPATDFAFYNIGNMGQPDVQTFFNFHGTQIKSLTLCLSPLHPRTQPQTMTSTLNLFHSILQRQCPHLQKIALLDYEPDHDWPVNKFEFNLPALKSIHWTPTTTHFAHEIIRGAHNLTNVEDFNVERDVDVLVESRKISAVQKLSLMGKEDPLAVTKFATGGPKLRSLTSNCLGDHPELSGAFEIILNSSRDTLQQIEISSVVNDGNLTEIKFPQFVKLKKLTLGKNFEHACFPKEINLTETFPNLNILDCTKLTCRFDSTFHEYFPPPVPFMGALTSVRTLHVTLCSDLWMEKLGRLCPNFKNLVVHGDHRLRLTLLRVFRLWTHVETLEIVPLDEGTKLDMSANHMDSIFTGLCVKTCERIRDKMKTSKKFEREKGFKQLRISPSICQLEGLTKLRMVFHHLFTQGTFPVSKVANLYGFSLMPRLQIEICFATSKHVQPPDQKKLESIVEQVIPGAKMGFQRVKRD